MLNVVKMAKRRKRAETPLLDSAAARLVKTLVEDSSVGLKNENITS